jgi:hypothetical protein
MILAGVWVRQSEWVWTNSIAVRGQDGLILIDPRGREIQPRSSLRVVLRALG